MVLLTGENNINCSMIKIAITGPESSGKTSLTNDLAEHFACPFSHEYARDFLQRSSGIYNKEDLLHILKGQINLEEQFSQSKHPFLFCDTDPLVIWIWSKVKYNTVDPIIDEILLSHHYDLHMLVSPDIEWEYDPLRESKDDRVFLFQLYKEKLIELGFPFVIIHGEKNERMRIAIKAIESLIT